MSHTEDHLFIAQVKRDHPGWFNRTKVLEFGSLNMNGSVRDFFDKPEAYVGVDWRKGVGVDVKSLFHEFQSDDKYDVFVSVNTLEHDPYWKKSLAAAMKHVVPGGGVIIVCGGPGMREHEKDCSPVDGYYGNVDPDELQKCLAELGVDGEARLQKGDHTGNIDTLFCGSRRNV